LSTQAKCFEAFGSLGPARITIEIGTHSPWVSRLLQELGHEVVVANPKQVKLITESSRKDDRLGAQTLARLARIDPQLLRPIQHRSDKAQGALTVIRVRAALMAGRTGLVNTARGLAKSMGERLPKCDADQMGVLQELRRCRRGSDKPLTTEPPDSIRPPRIFVRRCVALRDMKTHGSGAYFARKLP
jgi:transposase